MQHELQVLRQEIDLLDVQIVELLAARFQKSDAVADIKKRNALPVFDPKREVELFEKIRNTAKSLGLPRDVVESIFQEIVHQSRRMQERRKTL